MKTTLEYDPDNNRYYAVTRVNHLSLYAVFATNTAVILTLDWDVAIKDGQYLRLDAAPFVDAAAGRTLVPLRFLCEILGVTVEWKGEARQVIVNDGRTKIVMTIDDQVVLVNGKPACPDRLRSAYPRSRPHLCSASLYQRNNGGPGGLQEYDTGYCH